MKSTAREYAYWNNIDTDIENTVERHEQCQLAGKCPRRTLLELWPTPERAWKRIHADYAGPIKGVYYLIVVDAFSRWPEVLATKTITANKTADSLEKIFSRHGYPEELVTDNGTQFTASSTKEYCLQRGIRQSFTAPYSPMSNGQAEKFVDTFKRSLLKMKEEEETVPQKIRTILRTYRSTPNESIKGKTPAELCIGEKLHSKMDLLIPTESKSVNSVNAGSTGYKKRMKKDYDRRNTTRSMSPSSRTIRRSRCQAP